MANSIVFKVIGQDPDPNRCKACRRMLVGPWCNQPDEYEGYNGFVGWAGVSRLKSGRWLVAFNSGYWHASYPWTPAIHEEIKKDEKFYDLFLSWRKMGMPDVYAPRGGRCHWIHSDDQGLTWSKPETLVDTDWTDLHPTIMEMDDGSLLCTFCSDALPLHCKPYFMRSTDGGKTWSEPTVPPEGMGGFGNGSAIRYSDGSILWVMENRVPGDDPTSLRSPGTAIYRSTDQGKSFQRWSVARSEYDVYEPSIIELPNRRLALITRRKGDLCFSDDGGKTWTEPVGFGVEMYDPHLLMLPNGVLACFHGSYSNNRPGHLRVILSPDGGLTWHGAAEDCGYTIDPNVYGYCHPMLLPDGTVYLVYIHTGGHSAADARTEALWALRVRVRDGADGIDILPTPGSPAAQGKGLIDLQRLETTGGDPELGRLGLIS